MTPRARWSWLAATCLVAPACGGDAPAPPPALENAFTAGTEADVAFLRALRDRQAGIVQLIHVVHDQADPGAEHREAERLDVREEALGERVRLLLRQAYGDTTGPWPVAGYAEEAARLQAAAEADRDRLFREALRQHHDSVLQLIAEYRPRLSGSKAREIADSASALASRSTSSGARADSAVPAPARARPRR